jgi:aspartate ammonia-lyase
VLVLHLLPDCLVVEGSTAVPVCDPKATANVVTKDIFDCTRCPGLDRVVARFASPGMLLLNVMDPMLHEDLEVTIDELMKTQFDNLRILYVPAAW